MNSDRSTGKPIVLLGMMGSGKTRVGRKLADVLGFEFYDMDQIIEGNEGQSIPEIFDRFGEAYFRSLEADLLIDLLQTGSAVISTGGGVVLRDENRSILQEKAYSFWLKANVDVLYERLRDDQTRPLLQGGKLRDKLCFLSQQRERLYACADVCIDNNGSGDEDVMDTVRRIKEAYEKLMKEKDLEL